MNSTEIIHNDDFLPGLNRVVAIALDESVSSQNALMWGNHLSYNLLAIENVLKPESDMVVLLHSRKSETIPESFALAKPQMDLALVASKLEAHHRHQSFDILKRATAALKSKNFAVQSFSLIGDARDEISRKVNDINVNLLIVGNCGMGAIKRYVHIASKVRAFIGSTCDYLVHHVHCPVVVVKLDPETVVKHSISEHEESIPAPLLFNERQNMIL